MDIVGMLVVGAVAGWLAGQMMKGHGFGLIGNVVIGVIGAVLGRYLFDWAGISIGGGLVGPLVQALAGALVLLGLVGFLKKDF